MYQVIDATTVRRLSDGCGIPINPLNRDYQVVMAWLAQGNKLVTASPVRPPTAGEQALDICGKGLVPVACEVMDMAFSTGGLDMSKLSPASKAWILQRRALKAQVDKAV